MAALKSIKDLLAWVALNPTEAQAERKAENKDVVGILFDETLDRLRANENTKTVLSQFWAVAEVIGRFPREAATSALTRADKAAWKLPKTYVELVLDETAPALGYDVRQWETDPANALSTLYSITMEGVLKPVTICNEQIADGMSRAYFNLLAFHAKLPKKTDNDFNALKSYTISRNARKYSTAMDAGKFFTDGLHEGYDDDKALRAALGIGDSQGKQALSLMRSITPELWADVIAAWRLDRKTVTGAYRSLKDLPNRAEELYKKLTNWGVVCELNVEPNLMAFTLTDFINIVGLKDTLDTKPAQAEINRIDAKFVGKTNKLAEQFEKLLAARKAPEEKAPPTPKAPAKVEVEQHKPIEPKAADKVEEQPTKPEPTETVVESLIATIRTLSVAERLSIFDMLVRDNEVQAQYEV